MKFNTFSAGPIFEPLQHLATTTRYSCAMSLDIAHGDNTVKNSIQPAKKSGKRKPTDHIEEPSGKKHKHATPKSPQINVSVIHNFPVKKTKKKKSTTSTALQERDSTVSSPTPLIEAPAEPSTFDSDAQQHGHRLSAELGDAEHDRADDRETELASPFQTVRLSIYVPVYAIALASATQSLLSTHLAPLLLTYYAPAQGVVLAFSDPSIFSKPPSAQNHILHAPFENEIDSRSQQALAGEESGVSWVWLTAAVLLFRPERNMEMEGHLNICSEGFIGLSLYNYFQCGIAPTRIPSTWRWSGSADEQTPRKRRTGRKSKIKDLHHHMQSDDSVDAMELDDMEVDKMVENSGEEVSYFTDNEGNPVTSKVRFRVVDTDVIPSHGTDRWSLHVEGTLLGQEDEAVVLAEERATFERIQRRSP